MNSSFRMYMNLLVFLGGLAVIGPPAANAIAQLAPVIITVSDAVQRSQSAPWTLDSIRPR